MLNIVVEELVTSPDLGSGGIERSDAGSSPVYYTKRDVMQLVTQRCFGDIGSQVRSLSSRLSY